MSLVPPLQPPRRVDDAVVRVPPLEVTPVNLGLLVALLSFVFDQATKTAADRLLIPNRLVEVFPDWVPFFSTGWGWQLIYNPGGALGFGAPPWFFLVVTAIVTTIVARNLPRAVLPRTGVAYGLLLSGAWGNGWDRLTRPPGFPSGEVVDFIATRVPEFFPIGPNLARFNVADVAIGVGFVLLLRTLRAEEEAREEEPTTAAVPALGT